MQQEKAMHVVHPRLALAICLVPLLACDVVEKTIGLESGCTSDLERTTVDDIQREGEPLDLSAFHISMEHEIGSEPGCVGSVHLQLRSEDLGDDCTLQLAATSDGHGGHVLDYASLQASEACFTFPDEMLGSFAPGADFEAEILVDGELNDPDAAVACFDGSVTVHMAGSLERTSGEGGAATVVLDPTDIVISGTLQTRGVSGGCVPP